MEENGTISIYDTTPGYKLYYQYVSIDDSTFNKINDSEITRAEAIKLLPKYDESKWIKSDDNKFSIDSSTFEGKKSFAVWAKLVSADGTINYDVTVYSVSGTKKETATTESEEKKSDTQDNNSKDTTTATTKIPQTGQSFTIVFIIVVISMIGLAGFRFIRKNKDIK